MFVWDDEIARADQIAVDLHAAGGTRTMAE